MNTFVFTCLAEERLKNLPSSAQQQILQKLKALKNHDHIFSVLRRLVDFGQATHRLRIGKYRVILSQKKKNEFWILDVGSRKDIYK